VLDPNRGGGPVPPEGFDPADVAPPPLGPGPWPLGALALDVAGRCNLGCRYCAEAATQPRRRPMEVATLEAAWRLLFPDGRPRPGASIRLGSGEPLLNLPLLRHLADLTARGEAAGAGPRVFLTTNGTLVDDEVAAWLATTGWHVKVSLDGPAEVHDAWRVTPAGGGTYRRAAAAARALAPRLRQRFSATAVLCRRADPAAVFWSIASLGVERIELVPVAHRDPATWPSAQDAALYRRFVWDYAHRLAEADAGDGPLPTLVRFAAQVARVMGYDNHRVACGAGRTFLGVGPGGDLYPCFRFIGLEAHRLGHLAIGIDPSRAAAFHQGVGRPYDRRRPCDECWAAPLCGGPCFAVAATLGPGGGRPVDLHCAYVLADARAAVWLVDRLRRTNPGRLLAFLPKAVESGLPAVTLS